MMYELWQWDTLKRVWELIAVSYVEYALLVNATDGNRSQRMYVYEVRPGTEVQ